MKTHTAWRWSALVFGLMACLPGMATAGGHTCRAATTPCGDTGCGPRYRGAVHEEPNTPDPCDACNRWRGCNGARQSCDMLAPWQLPPGRGFHSPEQVGWRSGPCTTCGPRFPGP